MIHCISVQTGSNRSAIEFCRSNSIADSLPDFGGAPAPSLTDLLLFAFMGLLLSHPSRRNERHSLRHIHAVLVAQVAIHAHGQRATVFVSQPSAHRRNVHAAFNVACRGQMTQIVVRYSRHAHHFHRPVHCLLAFAHPHDRRFSRLTLSPTSQTLQQAPHLRNHRHAANSPVLRGRNARPSSGSPFLKSFGFPSCPVPANSGATRQSAVRGNLSGEASRKRRRPPVGGER